MVSIVPYDSIIRKVLEEVVGGEETNLGPLFNAIHGNKVARGIALDLLLYVDHDCEEEVSARVRDNNRTPVPSRLWVALHAAGEQACAVVARFMAPLIESGDPDVIALIDGRDKAVGFYPVEAEIYITALCHYSAAISEMTSNMLAKYGVVSVEGTDVVPDSEYDGSPEEPATTA